jgi:sarcosine oxidase
MKGPHVVIGGGIVGVCVAYFLAVRGREVLLLERDQLAAQFPVSSSGAPARMFRSAYGSDQYMTKLCTSSFDYWKYFEEISGEKLFNRTGWVIFEARDSQALSIWPSYAQWPLPGFATASAEILQAEGLPHEWLSKEALVERFPQIAANKFYDFALIDWTAGLFRADKAVKAIAKLAQLAGAEIRENTTVEELVWRDGKVETIVIAGGQVRPSASVILAAGYMNPVFAPEPTGVLKVVGESTLYLRPDDPAVFAPQRFPIVGHFAFPLDHSGTVHASPGGSTKDEITVDPSALDLSEHRDVFDPVFITRTRDILDVWLPELASAPAANQSRCFYPVTRNGQYKLYKKSNVVTLIACSSGTGFKTAPMSARLGAELAMREDIDGLKDFTPELYSEALHLSSVAR